MKRMRLRWDDAPTKCSGRSSMTFAGRSPELRDRKIEQLASAIAAMNNGNGPDLLGVLRGRNRFVVDRPFAPLTESAVSVSG